jgi:hypothetical protein
MAEIATKDRMTAVGAILFWNSELKFVTRRKLRTVRTLVGATTAW